MDRIWDQHTNILAPNFIDLDLSCLHHWVLIPMGVWPISGLKPNTLSHIMNVFLTLQIDINI